MIETFDVGVNFWEVHKDLRVIEPFKTIYLHDKKKDKSVSSLMMWFIVLCYDKNSKFYRLSPEGEDGKHKVIGEDFCSNPNYYEDNKKILDEAVSTYIKLTFSEAEQHLHKLKALLNKRSVFIDTQEYTLENYEKLDKMVVGTKLVIDTLKKAEEEVYKDNSKGIGMGGSISSLSD